MIKGIKKLFLLMILCVPLLACSSYKTVMNTKKLNNYEYTLKRTIKLNDKEEIVIEKGYVSNDIEKRITKTEDKEFTTYYEKTKNGSFIYSLNSNNEYQRKRIPCSMTSYLNLIDSKWLRYDSKGITLNDDAHNKILKLLHVHKYLADDVALDSYDIKDNGKQLNYVNVTLKLLKNNEEVGTANIEFEINNINNVDDISLPPLKERDQ